MNITTSFARNCLVSHFPLSWDVNAFAIGETSYKLYAMACMTKVESLVGYDDFTQLSANQRVWILSKNHHLYYLVFDNTPF